MVGERRSSKKRYLKFTATKIHFQILRAILHSLRNPSIILQTATNFFFMYLLPKFTVFGPQEKGSGETNVNEDGAYIYSLSPGYTYILHVSVLSA